MERLPTQMAGEALRSELVEGMLSMPSWQLARKTRGVLRTAAVAVMAFAMALVVAAQPAAAVAISPNAFVALHVVSTSNATLNCASNEVMVGVHLGQGKAICAQLNFGYRVGSTIIDPEFPATQVSSGPSMHGCPTSFLIQGINLQNELLVCVSLRDSVGNALDLTRFVHDGRGPSDDGTSPQSTVSVLECTPAASISL
jgi:hypothetical protein